MTAQYDLVIIGMGSAGLTAAEFAASLDLRVAVIERDRIGGDCLWTGCVPSKVLLASAKAAHTIRHADRYGLEASKPTIDLATVWRRIRAIQAEIAATDDNPQRYREMGLDMYHGQAAVTGPTEVTIDHDRVLAARYILLCTGSRPIVPDIPGLVDTGFLTSESVFELTDPPKSVAIIGGGPIGVELAQAFSRLGIVTTILQRDDRILLREEPQLAESLQAVLRSEGVTLHLRAEVTAVRVGGGHKTVVADIDGHVVYVTVDEILVAAGRRPNVDGLGLENLGIEATELAVPVDERGRTVVRSIYAVGDIAGRHRFTHSAGYEGIRAVRDMFFPGKGNVDDFIPWCTFTDPELAHAGMTVSEAEAQYGADTDVWQIGLDHNDRARADDATEGAIIIATAKRRIVGAHILAPSAGELIHELALAIRHQMKIDDIAQLVHVYPTLASSIGQLAASAALEKAQRLRWLVRRR